MTPLRPIPIEQSTVFQREEGTLVRAGISLAKSRLFLNGLQIEGLLPQTSGTNADQFVEAITGHMAQDAKKGLAEDLVILRAFERLLHPFYCVENESWNLSDQSACELAAYFVKGRIDLGVTWFRHIKSLRDQIETSVKLCQLGIADPTQLIDRNRLIKSGEDDGSWIMLGWSSNDRKIEDNDMTDLAFWLNRIGPSILTHMGGHLRTDSETEAVHCSRGISKAISRWFYRNGWHPSIYSMAGEDFAAAAKELFDAIDSRIDDLKDHALSDAWFRFALMACDCDPSFLTDSADRVRLSAADQLGVFRPLFRSAHEAQASEQFRERRGHWQVCLYLVYRLGGLWTGTRSLLHAFRALSSPALASDLRYWNDASRPDVSAPEPWCVIPMSLFSMFHSRAGLQSEQDTELEQFRSEFARFCLDRLKSRNPKERKTQSPTDSALVEPNPSWRECLIHAIDELRINPGKKGHHVLNWVSENDPDENVRAVAKRTYSNLRHGPSLPKDLSPRRVVIHAFWWLSQAHLLALGIKVDGPGAQRTREQEVRRTTESNVV